MEQLQEFAKEVVDRYIKSMGYNPETIDRNKRMAFTKTKAFQQYAERIGNQMEEATHVVHTMELGSKEDKPGKKIHISAKDNKDAWDKATKAVDKIPGHYIHKVVPINESKMSAVHADLGDLLDKHIDKYKSMGGAENLAHHTGKASEKLAKRHGISPEHATKFVNDYVDDKLKEAMEFPQGDFDPKGTSAKVVGEKKLSKKAKVVKEIFKKARGLGEELYDHEKDKKDPGTYGVKPKYSKAEQGQEVGDNAVQARAVLSGGKTLSGQPRDTVEFDPALKKPKPGAPNMDMGGTKQ
jgi:hypothetical protein